MDNNMRPLSLSSHSNFFSSLKQVEKRLKLEQTPRPLLPPESEAQESNSASRDSLASMSCSPMFLHLDQPCCSQNYTAQDSSEPPLAFLSIPHGLTPTQQDPPQTSIADHDLGTVNNAQGGDETAVDDIERLMQLLGLSEKNEGEEEDCGGCNSCHCEGGFYSKIVGVEGPKCRREVQRLDGWINHFLNGGGGDGEGKKLEPLRLAHLLLGKAAFVSEGADGGFGGLEFPLTIQEFLHNDPPSN